MTPINKPTDGKYGYIAFFNGKKVELYADSTFHAQKLATQYFKPAKSKQHMISVMLAETTHDTAQF